MLTNWSWKNFSELSNLELYHIMRLRQEVFLIEQKMHYVDADLKDIKSIEVDKIKVKGKEELITIYKPA